MTTEVDEIRIYAAGRVGFADAAIVAAGTGVTVTPPAGGPLQVTSKTFGSLVRVADTEVALQNASGGAGGSVVNSIALPSILDVTFNVTDLPIVVGPDVPVTLTKIYARTVSGTCTISFKRGGTDIRNSAGNVISAALTTTSGVIMLSTTIPQTLAAYGVVTMTVTGATALAGLIISISGVPT
ncbi:MAG: hypothetical protein IPK75_18895 [Acidobacteria bacterium]|nr:hypothetical protein [Acidobacteriota bacterium]